jgi:hypothetical protein
LAQSSQPRGPGRRFRKGKSGNPGGRAKGLRDRIRRATNNGDDLVGTVTQILTGRRVRVGGRFFDPTIDDQMAAATWLADHGWGKPASHIELLLSDMAQRRD